MTSTSIIPYITLDQLKATMTITGTNGDADGTAAIEAASRDIDGICNRGGGFGPGTPGEVRYFDAEISGDLEIDDVYGSGIVVQTDDNGDGTFVTTWNVGVDFEFLSDCPSRYNAPAFDWPWTRLEVRSNGAHRFLPNFTKSAKITGTFGWPEVPQGIIDATTLLAGRIYTLKRSAQLDVIPGGDQGMIRLGSKIPNVMMLVSRYQRHKIAVA